MDRYNYDDFYKKFANITQTEGPDNQPLSSNLNPKSQTNLEQGLESQKNTVKDEKVKDRDKGYYLNTAQIYDALIKRKIAYIKSQQIKFSYVSHCPGHKDSNGNSAEWCVKSHDDDHIISSHRTEAEAKKHLQDMHAHS